MTIIATGFQAHEVDAGQPMPKPAKSIYDLKKDSLTEVTQKISKPTQEVSKETEIAESSIDAGIDVSPEPEAEPFLVQKEEEELPTAELEDTQEEVTDSAEITKHTLSEDTGELFAGGLFGELATDETEAEDISNEADAIQEQFSKEITGLTDSEEETSEEPVKRYSLEDDHLENEDMPTLNPTNEQEETDNKEQTDSLIFTNKTVQIDEDRPSKDILIAKNKERELTIRELTSKLKTPSGLSDLEKEPAYKRRNVDLGDQPAHSSSSSVSRFTIGEKKDEKGSGLSENNPFLHDNVD